MDGYVGGALVYLLAPLKWCKRTRRLPRRILFVKLWAIGESIQTLPLIREVRRAHPGAKISVLVRRNNVAVYRNQEIVDEILLFEKENIFGLVKLVQRFDVVFDVEPYLNVSALLAFYLGKKVIGFDHCARALLYDKKIRFNDVQNEVQTFLDLASLAGVKVKDKRLVSLRYTKEDVVQVNVLLKKHGLSRKKLFGLAPSVGASTKDRSWPLEKYAELADCLVEKYKVKIVCIGAKEDRELIQKLIWQMRHADAAVNFAGETSVSQLFYLVARLTKLVSNDSGPMHVGAAQRVPTVGLFGPNLPVRNAPWGQKNCYVYKPTMKRPCINVHKGSLPDCRGHNHMSKITVQDVLNAVKKVCVV